MPTKKGFGLKMRTSQMVFYQWIGALGTIVYTAVDRAEKELGGFDIMVNNAGIAQV